MISVSGRRLPVLAGDIMQAMVLCSPRTPLESMRVEDPRPGVRSLISFVPALVPSVT